MSKTAEILECAAFVAARKQASKQAAKSGNGSEGNILIAQDGDARLLYNKKDETFEIERGALHLAKIELVRSEKTSKGRVYVRVTIRNIEEQLLRECQNLDEALSQQYVGARATYNHVLSQG